MATEHPCPLWPLLTLHPSPHLHPHHTHTHPLNCKLVQGYKHSDAQSKRMAVQVRASCKPPAGAHVDLHTSLCGYKHSDTEWPTRRAVAHMEMAATHRRYAENTQPKPTSGKNLSTENYSPALCCGLLASKLPLQAKTPFLSPRFQGPQASSTLQAPGDHVPLSRDTQAPLLQRRPPNWLSDTREPPWCMGAGQWSPFFASDPNRTVTTNRPGGIPAQL